MALYRAWYYSTWIMMMLSTNDTDKDNGIISYKFLLRTDDVLHIKWCWRHKSSQRSKNVASCWSTSRLCSKSCRRLSVMELDLSTIKLFHPVTVRSRLVLCITHVVSFSVAFVLDNERVQVLNYHGFFNTLIRICRVNTGDAITSKQVVKSVRSPSLYCYATASAGLIRRSFLLCLSPSIRQ